MEQETASLASESKPASKGGTARMRNLPPAERKALASLAANARWRPKKQDGGGAAPPFEPSPVPPTEPAPAASRRGVRAPGKRARRAIPAPKAFGAAHSYAEKRLAQCIEERAYYANMWAARNAEIPSLVQIIAALKNSRNPSLVATASPEAPVIGAPWANEAQQAYAGAGPTPAQQLAASRVRGGAVAVDLGTSEDDEDRFLRESGLPGGEWH